MNGTHEKQIVNEIVRERRRKRDDGETLMFETVPITLDCVHYGRVSVVRTLSSLCDNRFFLFPSVWV